MSVPLWTVHHTYLGPTNTQQHR